jgi:subfamily B ATP-binding cassette protein MsbA
VRNLWRAFKLVLPHRGVLILYVCTASGLALFGGAPLLLIKTFLNRLEGKPPHDPLSVHIDAWLTTCFGSGNGYLYGLCGVALALWFCKACFDFANTYVSSWLAQRLRMEAMERVMRRLLTLDQPYFDKHKIGDLTSRMVSDGDNLRRTVKTFLDFVQQPFIVVVLASTAMYLDWRLFLVGGLGLPLLVVPLRNIIKNIAKQAKKYQEKTAELSQAMLQNLTGMRIIHAYDAAPQESTNFARLARSLFNTGMRRNRSRAMQRPLTEIVLGIGLIAVLLYGGLRVIQSEHRDVAAFITFVMALAALRSPVGSMVSTMGEIAELLPSAERTFQVLDVQPTIQDAPNAVVCPALKKEIVFEKVAFDYGRGAILKDFNLTVRAGEKIGIVGRTGVGKSTLLSLMMRFYDPTEGRILIDGVDIRSATLASLRCQMALVSQQPFLFHTTVAENIRYGRPGATDEEITAAAQAAMVHDEIMQQPQGYQTLCGDRGGELFSGGQRQRIAVARAILRNAPILLLDEATSALDAFSERRVQEALDKLGAGRTSLIVAHRLGTLSNVDRIVVFADDGGVEAVGTHDQLLSTSPTYQKLAKMQHGSEGVLHG